MTRRQRYATIRYKQKQENRHMTSPVELSMLIAYAQAQQVAGRWTFNLSSKGVGYYEWKTDAGVNILEMADGGFLYSTTANDIEPVPVFNLTHLIALIAASNQAG